MKKLLFCTHKVNRANVKRETRNGVEHVVITSYTLPPDIVMNGGLYPTDERNKSFESLNRTPVTVEHPEIDGQYVSAADPEIEMVYKFGAWNENARITDDNRIALDKVINVQKALTVECGKRLLDRISEIETNENARPIHTSVGVFLDVEETAEIMTNDRGQEYSWVAKDMTFDHDAILLDSVGASTPDQGTGINVNKDKVSVMHYNCADNHKKKAKRDVKAIDFLTNELTFSEIENQLWQKSNQGLKDDEYNSVLAVYDDSFIYETQSNEMFRSSYVVDEKDNVSIQDSRLPVERVIEFRPINPTESTGDNAMRDSIIAELSKMGITVNADISDIELLSTHSEAVKAQALKANEVKEEKEELNVNEIVDNAVKAALSNQLKANQESEIDALTITIVNSGKYPDLAADDLKALGLEKVKQLAANCGVSHGIGSTMLNNEIEESDVLKTNVADLPE
jgi:hypothetical protein